MRPLAKFLVQVTLAAASAAFAEDTKPSPSDARPSMPFTGTATMEEDGSLVLHLRLTSDGKEIDDSLAYKTTDRGYDDVLRHLRGLRPGETRSFNPWKD